MFESLLPSLISAGANIFGGAMSAQGAAGNNATQMQLAQQNIQLQRETNAQQVQLFHENQDWQERMSNSAYQRQMADMRAAGLNPILAYQKGGGAGTPSTSPPSLSAPQGSANLQNSQGEIGRAIGMAATSAVDAYKNTQAAELTKTQNEIAGKEVVKRGFETNKAMWESNTAKQQYERTREETEDYKKYGKSGIGEQGVTAERIARRISAEMGVPFQNIVPLLKNAFSGSTAGTFDPQGAPNE